MTSRPAERKRKLQLPAPTQPESLKMPRKCVRVRKMHTQSYGHEACVEGRVDCAVFLFLQVRLPEMVGASGVSF